MINVIRRLYLNVRYIFFKTILPFPKIYSNVETLEKLISSNVSMARFGDGEFHMINQTENLGFQTVDDQLSQRLREILGSDTEGCLICVPYGLRSVQHLNPRGRFFWKQFIVFHYRKYIPYFNFAKPYYDACVTRPYIDWLDKSKSANFFEQLKQLWQGRRILLVEGQMSRLGVGNDLFGNATVVDRIITLSQNAFSVYDRLLAETIRFAANYDLVLVALGPTATVLAYDLSLAGIQALDIGHVDIEYEWFLKKATQKIAIEGKYVNEVAGETAELTSDDQRYKQQIISEIFTS
ncbi:GT-D fold domain-containing glycosyltransferase [Sphingobacterium sp. BIGb0165]|uniref:GT-D fold domain-containing glycosyltransferase n=1 Tax=Sphingobacterium sp. BIGb0165 TaxID=2940615 RepID=UPI00216AB091|nr:GT-D fold domain-containing glycosyltransferase [Sphingobacterium sp. BIGb0165]MCS4226493.1 glycosyltransferase family protein [Sphingobacterium sp. BIGb0165]